MVARGGWGIVEGPDKKEKGKKEEKIEGKGGGKKKEWKKKKGRRRKIRYGVGGGGKEKRGRKEGGERREEEKMKEKCPDVCLIKLNLRQLYTFCGNKIWRKLYEFLFKNLVYLAAAFFVKKIIFLNFFLF